jgi:hypothetical protein
MHGHVVAPLLERNSRLATRVGMFEERFGYELLDHDKPLRSQHNTFDCAVLVSWGECKLRRFCAHGLVLLRGQLDVFDALRIGALTHKLDVARVLLAGVGEARICIPDPLVDLPKEGFVRR